MGRTLDLESDDARKRIAELVAQGQTGRWLSSVAHDINNCLGAVMAYAELVSLEPSLSQDSSRMLAEIIRAAQKASLLLNHFVDLSRNRPSPARRVFPAKLLEQTLDLRRHDIKKAGATLETDFEQGLDAIAVDLPKMEHAILYVISNAIEAVEKAETRRIRVTLRRSDKALEIAFWNSGAAVPEQDRQRMFEPFFTTKRGPHLGLGLPLAREIARLHGGQLTYSPERGFLLYVPHQNPFTDKTQ